MKCLIYSHSKLRERYTVCCWRNIDKTSFATLIRASYDGLRLNLTSNLKTAGHVLHKCKCWQPNTSYQHCDLELWKRLEKLRILLIQLASSHPQGVSLSSFWPGHMLEKCIIYPHSNWVQCLWLENYSKNYLLELVNQSNAVTSCKVEGLGPPIPCYRATFHNLYILLQNQKC